MSYVDGYVLAVPAANREAYQRVAAASARHFKNHGATRVVETWQDDVPDGKVTSFPLAVQKKDDEIVVFSWVEWPDKATRVAAMESIMKAMQNDPEMNEMPFDGMRMIFGSFDVIVEA
ncbi:MAG: DUF1428 domain-containing protein [Pseudomonadota bacterium]